ncbi:hypothetical protein PENANT_c011G02874 [Penicillium antarcticum]|uniref:Uncharacterized protein n=1 Tax=Penicillium antarcticum TaxID=416450 RepID=A0A1V6Q7D1_9EURO|nr:hypothetical protein PENANT_c011G02874 [Penicillium antarcticum]
MWMDVVISPSLVELVIRS